MPESDSLLYEELANRYGQLGEQRPRDQCLVLAADAALNAGQADRAEYARQRLLAANPNHWLRPFDSMQEAMQSEDVRDLVADLRRQWPPETVKKLLRQREVAETVPVQREEPPAAPRVAEPVYQTAPVKEKKQIAKAMAIAEEEFAEPTALSSALATLVFLLGVILAGGILFIAVVRPLLGLFV